MEAQWQSRQPGPKMISLSGIDGAGKSTQIELLCATLQQAGLRVQRIAFWDDVAQFTRLRETTAHALFRGDRGVGSPENPIRRRDKNVQSLLMTVIRLGLYLADTFSLRRATRRAAHSGADLVIFDRYIYDELANLSLSKPLLRLFARSMAGLAPKPNASYLLDADPAEAQARKPEYPLEFLHSNRASYFAFHELISPLTVIPPMPAAEVQRELWKDVAALLPGLPSAGAEPTARWEAQSFPTAP